MGFKNAEFYAEFQIQKKIQKIHCQKVITKL